MAPHRHSIELVFFFLPGSCCVSTGDVQMYQSYVSFFPPFWCAPGLATIVRKQLFMSQLLGAKDACQGPLPGPVLGGGDGFGVDQVTKFAAPVSQWTQLGLRDTSESICWHRGHDETKTRWWCCLGFVFDGRNGSSGLAHMAARLRS